MEYNRIFSGFTMCNLLGETRYYDDNFVIAYLSVLMKFDYSLSISQSAQVRPASSRCGSVTPRV